MLNNMGMLPPKREGSKRTIEAMAQDNGSVSSGSYDSEEEEDDLSGMDSQFNDEDESSRDEEKEIQKIIRKETKDVLLWREIVTGMLVITAALVTVTAYIFLSREELDDFKSGFNERAAAVCSTVDTEIASLYESFAGLSGVMTSFAIATNAQWPEFTVPDFDEHVSHVLNLSPTEVFWTSHIVPTEKKGDWESYAVGQSTSFVSPKIYKTADGIYSPVTGPGPYLPIWQQSPAATSLVNFDEMSKPDLVSFMETVNALDGALISPVSDLDFILDAFGLEEHAEEEPHSAFIQPVYDSFDENRQIVAYLQSIISWEEAFSVVIPQSEEGDIHVVLRNSCGQEFTWEVGGEHAEFLGPGDLHQVQYESYKITADLTKYSDPAAAEEAGACQYFFDAYPTSSLRESYRSNKPQTYAAVVGVIFFLMALTFFMYDRFIQRRNEKVINAAARSNAIVAALFPSNVRDRLFAEANEEGGTKGNRWLAPKSGLKDFLATPEVDDNMIFQTKPIADLFPETTIMFADIVGFTAWSSVREPSQVFTLLETVYHAFDMIAKQRRIFKVETVGDCYVAVAGLPEPRKDHAVAMVKFAHECLRKISELTKRLEVELGPDTGDLTIRVGVHSGPVTAGVLRGERSRFQLFGDTMNTASRMESTGVKDKIQISQETADLLIASGKNHWVTPRADTVEAKGKGLMQTYFVNLVKRSAGMSTASSDESRSSYGDTYNAFAASNLEETELRADGQVQRLMSDKTNRLIDWNCDVLLRLIKQIVAARDVMEAGHGEDPPTLPDGGNGTGLTCLEEVKEIITLPEFDFKTFRQQRKPEDIELGDNVEQQLHDYISNIAIMYHENPFHSFEHASHVLMSVTKLLSRIVAPSDLLDDFESPDSEVDDTQKRQIASTLHDHTYGITSDPLTQFAVVLSALVHDVDHTGVPNATLVKENSKISALYKGKSVAEQNSVDLSWDLLMDESYVDLRAAIYGTAAELKRFRQLVVNTVMATDIMDKDLKALRNDRWDKAFEGSDSEENARDVVNRKATIVIEHIIQASDVAHTMQHWHIYRKWNERLFQEMYLAYQTGRSETDPSEFWYKGEMGFFDFYIIPLAKKLKDCGVFGVSSDEYLNYAMKNRKEWEVRGLEVVAEMKEAVTKKELLGSVLPPTPLLEEPKLVSATASQA